jgi:hypothetical protein
MSPRRGSTPRLTDRLTLGRNVTLTIITSVQSVVYHFMVYCYCCCSAILVVRARIICCISKPMPSEQKYICGQYRPLPQGQRLLYSKPCNSVAALSIEGVALGDLPVSQQGSVCNAEWPAFTLIAQLTFKTKCDTHALHSDITLPHFYSCA